jgi:AraC-like DNA-binding protein
VIHDLRNHAAAPGHRLDRYAPVIVLVRNMPNGRSSAHLTRDFVAVTISAMIHTSATEPASVHPRTLQRRLAAEETSFATLLDDVRRHAARSCLTGTDLPLTQVAGLLNFSQQAALTHSCRRWWSATPTAVRTNTALAE